MSLATRNRSFGWVMTVDSPKVPQHVPFPQSLTSQTRSLPHITANDVPLPPLGDSQPKPSVLPFSLKPDEDLTGLSQSAQPVTLTELATIHKFRHWKRMRGQDFQRCDASAVLHCEGFDDTSCFLQSVVWWRRAADVASRSEQFPPPSLFTVSTHLDAVSNYFRSKTASSGSTYHLLTTVVELLVQCVPTLVPLDAVIATVARSCLPPSRSFLTVDGLLEEVWMTSTLLSDALTQALSLASQRGALTLFHPCQLLLIALKEWRLAHTTEVRVPESENILGDALLTDAAVMLPLIDWMAKCTAHHEHFSLPLHLVVGNEDDSLLVSSSLFSYQASLLDALAK